MPAPTIDRIFNPDSKHLGSVVSGMSGSGKTTAMISMLQKAIKSKKFGASHRFIIIDPKRQPGDWDLIVDPISKIDKATKSIRENRVTLYYPEIETLEEEVSYLADYIFELATQPLKKDQEQPSFTFILDEASILITPTRIPTPLKRLAIQGRAKRIMPIWMTQRPLVNRWTDANVSNMFIFKTLPVDADALSKRWGLDFEEVQARIAEKPYSFMWFDLEKIRLSSISPVELPKRMARYKKKRSVWNSLFS